MIKKNIQGKLRPTRVASPSTLAAGEVCNDVLAPFSSDDGVKLPGTLVFKDAAASQDLLPFPLLQKPSVKTDDGSSCLGSSGECLLILLPSITAFLT